MSHTVWAWGANTSGQLGINSTTPSASSIPVQVKDPSGSGLFSSAIAVSAGFNHSLALKSDGSVWAWGDNGSGELGNNTTTSSSKPVRVRDFTGQGFISGIIFICAGYYSSYAIRSDGTVWAWGENPNGQLGNGSTRESQLPVQVRDSSGGDFLRGVISVSAGYFNYGQSQYTLALKSDGTVWAWGSNNNGQLGINNNTITQSSLPMQVVGPLGSGFLSGIVAISAGSCSLALSSDGTVWAWGSNGFGELGNNSTSTSLIPVQVQTSPSTMAVMGSTTGDYSGGCVMQDLSLRGWGDNSQGWLGDGTQTTRHTPVTVLGPLGIGAFGL